MAQDSPPPRPLFRRLTGRPGGMAPEEVAQHQKARLEGAMVEAVARHGFAGATLRELVALAGVSKSTFYEHFESKQACFLATFDEIVKQAHERVGDAYREADGSPEKLATGVGALMQMVVDEPAAASLAIVESLTLGASGVAPRERAWRDFERMVQQCFEHSPSPHEVSALTVRAIVAGIRGVVYRRLRSGSAEDLPGLVDTLVDWAICFEQPDAAPTRQAVDAARRPATPPANATPEDSGLPPGWEEPPDSRRSRRTLSQRDRIVRSAARVVAERGYESLSIPAISRAAGVSNQTFYEHFAGKRDAFLSAFDLLAVEALTRTAAAFEAEGDRPEAIGAGLRALLEHIAADELFARLAFFELPTGGPEALDQADTILDRFAACLEPGTAPSEIGRPLPKAILEAISSGIWATIQHEIAHGRRATLPELAPDVTRLAVAPFGGLGAAAAGR